VDILAGVLAMQADTGIAATSASVSSTTGALTAQSRASAGNILPRPVATRLSPRRKHRKCHRREARSA
jgi:hypothetical protein